MIAPVTMILVHSAAVVDRERTISTKFMGSEKVGSVAKLIGIRKLFALWGIETSFHEIYLNAKIVSLYVYKFSAFEQRVRVPSIKY